MNEVFFRFDDLKKRVAHLRDMIDSRAEVKIPFLGKAKKGLTDVLDEDYDHDSPESSINWAKRAMWRVDRAKVALFRAQCLFGGELPQTINAHQCAANMVKKIGIRIKRAENNLTKRKK